MGLALGCGHHSDGVEQVRARYILPEGIQSCEIEGRSEACTER